MAVVPHHLPSKQIWSDCLIKPAALSAIRTCFLPAKYSITLGKGLEKQGKQRTIRSQHVKQKIHDIFKSQWCHLWPPANIKTQKLWQCSCRVLNNIVLSSRSRQLKASPSSSRYSDVCIFTSNSCTAPRLLAKENTTDDVIINTFRKMKQTKSKKEPITAFSVLQGVIMKLRLHPEVTRRRIQESKMWILYMNYGKCRGEKKLKPLFYRCEQVLDSFIHNASSIAFNNEI